MSSLDSIKIVNMHTPVESVWLTDIIEARMPVLVLRDFLKPESIFELNADLEACRESIRVSTYSNGTLTTLGPYLAKHTRQPISYFDQVADIQPMLPRSLLGMTYYVYGLVKYALQIDTLKTASEPELTSYSGSIVRFHADGVANPLHNDNILRDASGTGLVVTNITQQLSCVVCLQECTSGGILRIYKKKWDPTDEAFKTEGELGYPGEVVKGCEVFEFSPRRGDIYIFNPNYYHEIDRVFGETRITLGFFFGLTDAAMKKAIAWS
ncbi:2OG-Fe(II)-dependent halogenase WelO5 family protein [Pseudomonas sp. LB3P31]